MINVQAFIQLKAFARQDGAILALVWIISFAIVVYQPHSILGNLLAYATPFVVCWRLISFRNSALDRVISFRRAFAYSCYTFFYASVLFAIAQYLYFRFLDNGVISAMIQEIVKAMAPVYKQNGMSQQEITDTLGMFSSMSPIQLALMFLMQNLLIGLILSLPIAGICMRKTAPTHK